MTIKTNTQVGAYTILAPLGAGGMGEVYRARDTRLDREVAIKVLPTDFANDAGRLMRFEQEARATSALNHPNILTIYDIGNYKGAPFIVAELLEGEELRAQLGEGALPMRKSIEYAQQIASGLAAAHEKGIVHRDLKPENLFVTRDGRVKILDFGLAKLSPQRGEPAGSDVATQMKITNPGTVMGTVGYMSPEQLRGQEADHRADIFSFGAILYEMLAGQRAFQRETAAETMTAILKEEPPELSEAGVRITPGLEKIVRRCLEKKPERRFHSAHDLAFALEAVSVPSGDRLEMTAVLPASKTNAGRSRPWMWTAILLGAIALAVSGWLILRTQSSSGLASTTWVEIGPPHQRFALWPSPAISADGRQIAFWATDEAGKTGLWVRSLDSPVARLLPGTADDVDYSGNPPFWSPDGRSLGFFAESKLKRIDLAGGTPQTLADAANPRGGSWGTNGIIIFVPTASQTQAVYQIPATGGEATPLPLSVNSKLPVTWPHFLPDGRHFFVTTVTDGVFVGTLDAKEARHVSKVMSRMEYADGYVFFGQNDSLFAQPFDEQRLALSGEPFRIGENLGFSWGDISAFAFSVSLHRNLVYWGGPWMPLTQLTWFNRAGQRLRTVGEPGECVGFALSPTGRQAVLERHDPKTNTTVLWLLDTSTGVSSKFKAGSGNAYEGCCPVWSPTDDRVLFVTWPGGVQAQSLRGGEPEGLLSDIGWLNDISPDGHYAVLSKNDPVTGEDMWLLPLTGERTLKPYLTTKNNEWSARFSPDGRWLAYSSDESGRLELYVQSFPEPGRKVRISSNGGLRPEWRKDGKELYYLSSDDKLMAVSVDGAGPLFQASPPQPLFTVKVSDASRQQYLASADGTQFLVNARVEGAAPRALTVVLNFKVKGKK